MGVVITLGAIVFGAWVVLILALCKTMGDADREAAPEAEEEEDPWEHA